MAACTGVRVLEIAGGFGAASLCGQLFAGLGAQVVKLEPREGDPLRRTGPLAPDGTAYQFHLLNAAKQSARLPAEAGAARKLWFELAEWADVVLLEGELAGLPEPGLDPKTFCDQWPAKVLCSISIFGAQGARKSWVGNELVAEAMGGLMSCTGYPEKPPVCSGVPYALHVTALFGFNGIMAALWERDRSGRGQLLDLGVVDCLVALLGNFIPSYFLSGRSPKRIGNRHTIAAPWNLYPTADGYVVICTGTGGSGWWKTVTEAIDRPDLTHDPRYDQETKRVARVDEVDQIVADWTQRRPAGQVVEIMTEAGIPASEISSVEAVLADPHYREIRAMVGSSTVETNGRRWDVPLVGLPLKVGAWSPPPHPGAALLRFDSSVTGAATIATTQCRAPRLDGRLLEGMRILEFGSRTSVPMAGRMLADLGADVVKIEPKKGESLRAAGQQIGGSSYLFHINNAGKRSVVIEPTDPQGRELILKLAEKADVWMENLAPGALESMGLGYAALRAVNPNIVYVSVSGFGLKSNYGKKRALDTVVQAACGIMHLTGYPDHLPVKIGISAVDLATSVGLIGAVIGALRQRRATGSGMQIDLAMADVGVWMSQSVWPQIFSGQGKPTRLGNRSNAACPHNIFAARDGFVAIAVDTDDQWRRLARLFGSRELIGDASLATAEGRLRSVERIENAISQWLEGMTRERAATMCQAAAMPAAPVRNLAEVVEDQETIRRGLVVEVEHPIAGRMRLLGNPLHFSRTPAVISACAPILGEHTREILGDWLGLSENRFEALRSAGVVATRGDSGKRKAVGAAVS